MGLYIYGKKTRHHLASGYSKLHQNARYLALVYCGMPDNIGENKDAFNSFMYFPNYETNFENMNVFIYSIQLSGYYFPNLLMHSDCDGKYTKNGKDAPTYNGLLGGNSKKLLKELEILCNDEDLINHKLERVRNALDYTIKFRDLVKDELENGTGTILFI